MAQRVLNVIEGEVKIAAGMDADRVGYDPAQLFDLRCNQIGLELVLMVAMRTGDDIGSAALRGHTKHGDGLFQRLSSVVDAMQDMAVDVDKVQMNISSSCVT